MQDHDYLSMAAAIDPAAVEEIVNRIIPKVVWEVGVTDTTDPTWVRTDISWSNDPDIWEEARDSLAQIILAESSAVIYRPPSGLPLAMSLYQNYPNPFNFNTTIGYFAPANRRIKLVVYDILGREIRVLANGYAVIDGFQNVQWDGKDNRGKNVGSGVYFYRLSGKTGYVSMKKMILLK